MRAVPLILLCLSLPTDMQGVIYAHFSRPSLSYLLFQYLILHPCEFHNLRCLWQCHVLTGPTHVWSRTRGLNGATMCGLGPVMTICDCNNSSPWHHWSPSKRAKDSYMLIESIDKWIEQGLFAGVTCNFRHSTSAKAIRIYITGTFRAVILCMV